jgi:hypothetical protein
MELEGVLLCCSQDKITSDPYSELDKSGPRPPTHFLNIHFNFIL